MKRARARRRAAAALGFAAALLLSGGATARADHWDDDPNTGAFTPSFEMGPTDAVTDTETSFTVRMSQPDHQALVRSYEVSIPAGWRFGFGSLDRSTLATCRNLPNDRNQIKAKAEHVAFANVTLETNGTRNDNPQFTIENGLEVQSPGPAVFRGDLWFLAWNDAAREATLCAFGSTNNSRIAPNRRLLVQQVTMTLQADTSWTMRWDYAAVPGAPAGERSIVDNAAFGQDQVSVTAVSIVFDGVTPGNFNKRPDGKPEPRVLVRSPVEPGEYRVAATFTPCAAADPSRCKSARASVTREAISTVTLPPGRTSHAAALITGPTSRGLPAGFGLVRGDDTLTVSWRQPDDFLINPVDQVKGYVVSIAEPGQQETLHPEYVVTDPGDPSFDGRRPCGAEGIAEICSLSLRFPLSSMRGLTLHGDTFYDVSLITVYRDGHRTDGFCDDGSALGAACPAERAGFNVSPPGVATWQVLVRPEDWPLAFVAGSSRTLDVLLVNFPRRGAEFVSIDRKSGRPAVYPGRAATIQGNGDTGIVAFTSAPTGLGEHFAFVAAITSQGAFGVFALADLKNLGPGGPSGVPQASAETYSGRPVT